MCDWINCELNEARNFLPK